MEAWSLLHFLFVSTLCFLFAIKLSSSLKPQPSSIHYATKPVGSFPMVSFPIRHIGKLTNDFILNRGKEVIKTPISMRGNHVVEVRIGEFQWQTHLLLDTGSSLVWWQCKPCDCFPQFFDPFYQNEVSTSYYDVDCNSDACDKSALDVIQGCRKHDPYDRCYYRLTYMDHDSTEGVLGNESLWTEDGKFIHNLIFGCGKKNVGAQFRGNYAGILGFDQNKYSFPTQVGASKFSYCLPGINNNNNNIHSLLYLYDFPKLGNDTFNVSLLPNPWGWYCLDFRGVAINDDLIPVSPQVWKINPRTRHYGVTVDTGTTITRFPEEIYNIFRDKFVEIVEQRENYDYTPLPPGYHSLYDTCFDVLEGQLDDFPTVSFSFGDYDKRFRLDTSKTLIWKNDTKKGTSNNLYCLAFAPMPVHHLTILGSFQMENTRMSFDLSKNVVSISPYNC